MLKAFLFLTDYDTYFVTGVETKDEAVAKVLSHHKGFGFEQEDLESIADELRDALCIEHFNTPNDGVWRYQPETHSIRVQRTTQPNSRLVTIGDTTGEPV